MINVRDQKGKKKTRRGDVNSRGETQKLDGGKGSVVYFTCSAFAFWTRLLFCIIERISAVIWKKKNTPLSSLAQPSIPHSTSHKRHSDGVCRISFSVASSLQEQRAWRVVSLLRAGSLFFCILARSYEYIGFSLNKKPT